jgi:hypothetical protein
LKQASPAELLNVKVDDARLKSKYEVGRMGRKVFAKMLSALTCNELLSRLGNECTKAITFDLFRW